MAKRRFRHVRTRHRPGGGDAGPLRKGVRCLGVTGLAGALLAAGMAFGPGTVPSEASSHWDAPMVVADPQIDATDLYAFTSPDAPETVTVIANYHPFQAPNTPVPYHFATKTRYDLNIDSTGDGKPEITYRWTFRNEDRRGLLPAYVTGPVTSLDDVNLRFRQHYTLQRIRPGSPPQTLVRDAIAAPTHLGSLFMPDYAALRKGATEKLPDGGRTYVGQAADPFYTSLKATGLIRFGTPVPPIKTGTPLNVHSMVLQVPKKELALKGDAASNPVIGVWATASRKSMDVSDSGAKADGYRQLSRVGNPTFNEVFVRCPTILPCSANDRYNASQPAGDRSTEELYQGVMKPTKPALIEKHTGVKPPAEPRNDLAAALLTGIADDDLTAHRLNKDADPAAMVPAEELRLNMSTPVTAKPEQLGYLAGDMQGFPNGRRLGDDVSAIVLGLLEGALIRPGNPGVTDEMLGDGPTKPTSGTFPYLALPLHV